MRTGLRKAVATLAMTVLVSGVLAMAASGEVGAAPAPGAPPPAVQWGLDNVKLSTVTLPPQMKVFVNRLLTAAAPRMCPQLAAQVTPMLRGFVSRSCLAIGTAKDPFAQLQRFAPVLCGLGPVLLPAYKNDVKAACAYV